MKSANKIALIASGVMLMQTLVALFSGNMPGLFIFAIVSGILVLAGWEK